MPKAIQIENLAKLYRLGEIGAGSLSQDLARYWAKLRGKEDPFSQLGQTNDRTRQGEKGDIVWALKDINFALEEGEVLGIIGRNGAGKSTLLKLLSRVTSPTSGIIKTRGRIASLLEVGTGFHHELTGRENIYLNGAILGMRRHEVTQQLDRIVEFSGCAKYLDTPVKRYSSGMLVRLGFAVAAHLQCEILVVDEVLAVGDAEFQKRCIDRMRTLSTERGRTVLFVSHNLASVEALCTSGIVIDRGESSKLECIEDALSRYRRMNVDTLNGSTWNNSQPTGETFVRSAAIFQKPSIENDYTISLSISLQSKNPKRLMIAANIRNELDTIIMQPLPFSSAQLGVDGSLEGTLEIDSPPLIPGHYTIDIWIGTDYRQQLDFHEKILDFEITQSPSMGRSEPHSIRYGNVVPESRFITNQPV